MQGSGVVGEREREREREREFGRQAGDKELIRTKFLQHRTNTSTAVESLTSLSVEKKNRIVDVLRGRPADLEI